MNNTSKHLKLAYIIMNQFGENTSWNTIKEYIEKYSKYDNFTYRDIDKTFQLCNDCFAI